MKNADQGNIDGDEFGDSCDTDADNDGILDAWEMIHFLDLTTVDATSDYDYDDMLDIIEAQAGTLPRNQDTDQDGLADGVDPLPLDGNYQDGDLDASGAVDVLDYMFAIRIAMGIIEPTVEHLQHGDVTPLGAPNGVIDISDALVVLRKAHGLIEF